QNYNRVHGFPIAVTEQLSTSEWIREWFLQLYNWDKWLVYPAIIGLGAFVYRVVRKRLSAIDTWLSLALLLQLGLWAYSAPDPRFVYGPLMVLACVGPLLMAEWLGQSREQLFGRITALLCFLFLTAICAGKLYTEHKNLQAIYPSELPTPSLRKVNFPDYTINLPRPFGNNWNPRCYATDLPCAYRIDPRLKPRGQSPGDGFRIDYSLIDSLQKEDLIYLEN